MKFGHFDDNAREYVITNPKTPTLDQLPGQRRFLRPSIQHRRWLHLYKDAKFRRLTRYRYNNVPVDNGGKYFYINDGGDVWNPGWKPTKTELESYSCRHGLSYTRITGKRNGVEAEALYFIPLGTWAEIQKIKLTNTTSGVKNSSYFPLLNGVCGTRKMT